MKKVSILPFSAPKHYDLSSLGNWKSLIFFRFTCFRRKYLKCTFTFFYILGCELIPGPQASKAKNHSNSTRRRQDVMNEYVKDQLNVASKNLASFFMRKLVNNIWKIFAP